MKDVKITTWAAVAAIVGVIPIVSSILASPFAIVGQVDANEEAIHAVKQELDQNHAATMIYLKEARLDDLNEKIRILESEKTRTKEQTYRLNYYTDVAEKLERELRRINRQ